jgi:hypothetical protein
MKGVAPEHTKFKKGVSGNPKGKPKGVRNRSTIVKQYLEALITQKNALSGEQETLPASDLMTLKLIETVLKKGDVQAFKELMDSGYGANKQQIEQTTEVKLPSHKEFIDKLLGE